MTRLGVLLVLVIVAVMAVLLAAPPAYPDDAPITVTPVVCKAADCSGPLVITATPHGPVGTPVAVVHLPIVVNCGDCLSAWPIFPEGGVAP